MAWYQSAILLSTKTNLTNKIARRALLPRHKLSHVLISTPIELNFIIFSDSKSSLEAINNFQIEVALVQKSRIIPSSLTVANISSCVGYQVTRVSAVMKKPTLQQKQLFHFLLHRWNLQLLNFSRVNKLISEDWQQIWDNCAGNKLWCIQPTVGTYIYAIHPSVVVT